MAFTSPDYRVQLRPVRISDVDSIMEWINDPQVTRNFAGMSEPITREQETAFLSSMIESKTDRMYAVESNDGVMLGTAGIHKIYWPARNGRLGLVLGVPSARGRGLGQQTLQLLTALGFNELKLHKTWIMHYASNARMHHIVRKLGFTEEGVLRDEYFHKGVFHDMLRHSMLEDEFREIALRGGLDGTEHT